LAKDTGCNWACSPTTSANLWRRLVLPTRIDTWSLTSLQQRLVKTGGRMVRHARYYWLLLAESHLTRRLFGSMLRRILALPIPTGWRGSALATVWGEERAQRGRCIAEMWAASCSSAGIQVAMAGVMMFDGGGKNVRPRKVQQV
jgi:hypothetical protein